MGVWVSITFSIWKDLWNSFVHSNIVAFLVSWYKGQATWARYLMSMECHFILPMNYSNSFRFSKVVIFDLAITLSKSTARPFLETMCPNNTPILTAKAYFTRLSFNFVSQHPYRHNLKWNKCLALSLATLKSYMKTFFKVHHCQRFLGPSFETWLVYFSIQSSS